MRKEYQRALGEYARVPVKPRLEPLVIPRGPVHHDYYNGIMMNGVYPQVKMGMMAYYSAPKAARGLPNQAPVGIPSVKVFVGVAPVRGVYTGVKNGRY